MRALLSPAAAGLGLILASGAAAQGADDCSGAPAINGLGNFAFNSSGSTNSGSAPCGSIGRDVWFAWTAPSNDTFRVSTCGLVSFDTVLAAYASCGSSSIACNDDACGLQSTISFSASAGSTYYIRVGAWNGSASGPGQFEISVAPPDSCSNPATGADVIVGEIPGISNYGATGGMGGYALGTTSCNVGTDELLWISNNNQHPVIGQNIYRAENGRFEQVGMSWLKHGFTALQQNLCCSCNSSGTGSRLGVGCSDPYSSGLNGSQGGLGPRFQVNAFTGAFPYPYFAQGQSGDRVFKRIQVANDDVDPGLHPTALYFGEAQYISPDDSAAGNGANNVSWCPLSRPGSTTQGAWRLSIGGSTVREEAALEAWPTIEAGAIVADINVPGEGQFIAGSNVIDNGDGTFRYEYAVFNNTSDFSGQSFTVPVGSSNVTQIGMSFPQYHSGEPYTNTAWTSTNIGGELTWQCETFAQDSNGNAIRWGTTYSFWFTSDAAPTSGDVTLGLFKPGNPGDQAVALEVPDSQGGGFSQTNYCQGNPNSSGQIGDIDAVNVNLPGRSFDLLLTGLPTNAFGIVITSLTSGFLPNQGGSSGNLCVTGNIGRNVGGNIFDSSFFGLSFVPVDMDVIPTSTQIVGIQPGETRYFQGWFRDQTGGGIPTSNFTVGLEMIFP